MTAAAAVPAGGSAARPVSVLIFAGWRQARERLVGAVGAVRSVQWWECVGRAEELVSAVARRPADVVVVGVQRAAPAALEVVSELARVVPGVRVLVVGAGDDQRLVVAVVAAGAHGYLRWDALGSPVLPALLLGNNINTAARRGVSPAAVSGLSRRELQVLSGMARGLTNGAIAAELRLTEDTVKSHARNLCRKLGVPNRQAAVMAALRAGLLS